MNSGCEEIQAQLSDYAEGELGDAAGCRIEEHLKSCRTCAGELTLMRALVSGLHKIPEETAPPAVLAAISRRLRERPSPALRPAALPAWLTSWRLAAAGAFAGMAVVAVLMMSPGRSSVGTAPVVVAARPPEQVEAAAALAGGAALSTAIRGVTLGGQPTAAGATVAEGARIETPAAPEGTAAAVLAYSDGTTVEVGGAAKLVAGADELRLETGALALSVEKQKLHFRVRTPEAVITVWGTRYRVTHRTVTTVEVQEGKVQVESLKPGAGSVVLIGGQRAQVEAGRLHVPKPATATEPVRPEDTRLPLGDDR
ncbi:MAG: FecR domain-containing protein [Candidatus Wallbacteria bacterium]|nr:FecR domain-containing protein [Candidatus Wallbacteria bacterium]